MNFKKRKIQNTIREPKAEPNPTLPPLENLPIAPPSNNIKPNRTHYVGVSTIIAGLILIFGLLWITVNLASSLDFGSIVFSFGKDLKKDDTKQTNFLLVGVGGYEHDGSNLTDTIMIASLNAKDKTVKMISLPRDLYIDNKQSGGERINKIYDTYLHKYKNSPIAMTKLAEEITAILGVPIHYTVKVNFNGFVKIVDAIGGVTVDVENSIHDPYYPKGETIYFETFDLAAGLQKLDGATALKYARSRKTTSDFDRAKRQQSLMSAIKEQALNINLLTDPGKIQALYNSIADSIETNLSISEIIELAKIAKDIPKDSIQSRVISDDFTSCGGFLYPPNRDYFAGASVLLPAGNNFDEIKKFSQNYFNNKENSSPEIQVLNGTKVSGLALEYLNRLSRECLNVVYYGNATNRDLQTSTIYYNPTIDTKGNKTIPYSLTAIKKIIDAPIVEGIPPEYLESIKRANTQIVVEFGQDYKKITSKDSFDKLLYITPIEPEVPVEIEAEKPLNSSKETTTTSDNTTSKTKTPTPSTPGKKTVPVTQPVN